MPAATSAYLFSKHELYNSATVLYLQKPGNIVSRKCKNLFHMLLLVDNSGARPF